MICTFSHPALHDITLLTRQSASLKSACPKGIYLTPVPDEPLTWAGVLFLRKGTLCRVGCPSVMASWRSDACTGPYVNAILRFRVDFPESYPQRPPVITFLSDIFHPLVTPLTTYTHTTRAPGTETVSSADPDRLPPGGFSLRHGFPVWFESSAVSTNCCDQRRCDTNTNG